MLIGTVGTAAEWGWSHVWMPLPWPGALLPEVLVVTILAGLGGGLIGTFIGGALRVRPQPFPRGARVVFPLAGVLVAGLIAFGLMTSSQPGVSARVQLQDVPGQGGRAVNATVSIDPPSAAEDAKWLTSTAWQGGGLVVDRLARVRGGVYRTNEPMPVHGDWKAEIRLHTGRSLIGVPVYLPNDPAIPAKGVPARRRSSARSCATRTSSSARPRPARRRSPSSPTVSSCSSRSPSSASSRGRSCAWRR